MGIIVLNLSLEMNQIFDHFKKLIRVFDTEKFGIEFWDGKTNFEKT